MNKYTIGDIVNMTLKKLEKIIYISTGNEKLKSDKKTLFLIFNLPAVLTCPGRTKQCTKKCYARTSEKMYKNARNRRKRNLDFSKTDLFVTAVIRFIDIKLNHLKKDRKIVFRIHESGDFYNQEYTNKWISIMRHYENDTRISFIAYTKSVWYFENLDRPTNFELLFSVWPDTKPEDLETAEKLNLRIYTAFPEGDKRLDEYFICRCFLCGGCLACENNRIKQIAAVIR